MCLLRNNVFDLPDPTMKARLEKGALKLRQALRLHYKSRARNPNQKNISRVQNFSLKKLGALDRPCLKAKGAPSKAFIWFCRDMLRKYRHKCGEQGQLLAESCDQLIMYYDLLRSEHRRMRKGSQRKLLDHCIISIQAYKAAGGYMVPKHHAFVHLSKEPAFSGNPRFKSTYEDESENGIIAKICTRVHRSTFVTSVFERIQVYDACLDQTVF